jgi:protein gp37
MKLDLHGIYHSDVPNLVDRHLWKCMQEGNLYECDIVTGNSEKMKEIVINIVEEYGLSYTIGNPWNKGFIRVSFLV